MFSLSFVFVPVRALEVDTPEIPVDEPRSEARYVNYALPYPFTGVYIEGVYSVNASGNVISSDLSVYSTNPMIVVGNLLQYPNGNKVRCIFEYYSYLGDVRDSYAIDVQ